MGSSRLLAYDRQLLSCDRRQSVHEALQSERIYDQSPAKPVKVPLGPWKKPKHDTCRGRKVRF